MLTAKVNSINSKSYIHTTVELKHQDHSVTSTPDTGPRWIRVIYLLRGLHGLADQLASLATIY